jgi:hypothetical protein
MESEEEVITFIKLITPFYSNLVPLEEITFMKHIFIVEETRRGKDRLPLD